MTQAPDQQVADLDRLFRACIEEAGPQLADGGEFWPFALAVAADGELVTPQVDPGEARPEPERVVKLLRHALREGSAGLRATAVCSDVRIAQDGGERDAVKVELEDAAGHALLLVVPYAPGPEFSEPLSAQDERRIWA